MAKSQVNSGAFLQNGSYFQFCRDFSGPFFHVDESIPLGFGRVESDAVITNFQREKFMIGVQIDPYVGTIGVLDDVVQTFFIDHVKVLSLFHAQTVLMDVFIDLHMQLHAGRSTNRF